jgi:hypothetical protein
LGLGLGIGKESTTLPAKLSFANSKNAATKIDTSF